MKGVKHKVAPDTADLGLVLPIAMLDESPVSYITPNLPPWCKNAR